jgi:hypothetical protein
MRMSASGQKLLCPLNAKNGHWSVSMHICQTPWMLGMTILGFLKSSALTTSECWELTGLSFQGFRHIDHLFAGPCPVPGDMSGATASVTRDFCDELSHKYSPENAATGSPLRNVSERPNATGGCQAKITKQPIDEAQFYQPRGVRFGYREVVNAFGYLLERGQFRG